MQKIATVIVTGIIAIASHTSYASIQATDTISEDDPPDIQVEVAEDQFCTLDVVSCERPDGSDSDSAQALVPDEPVRQVVASAITDDPRPDVSRDTVEQMVRDYALEYNVNVDTALRIANCESNFNPYARNKHSTAKGVYQFLDGTWAGYCRGDVFDADSNIQCFMQLYPTHPSWWECK